jgi:hypothetical protein
MPIGGMCVTKKLMNPHKLPNFAFEPNDKLMDLEQSIV